MLSSRMHAIVQVVFSNLLGEYICLELIHILLFIGVIQLNCANNCEISIPLPPTPLSLTHTFRHTHMHKHKHTHTHTDLGTWGTDREGGGSTVNIFLCMQLICSVVPCFKWSSQPFFSQCHMRSLGLKVKKSLSVRCISSLPSSM